MRPVFRRIAIHGAIAALALGLIGLLFAEMASVWLAASPGTRQETGEPIAAPDENEELADRLRVRVPLLMALWGFLFVALGELVLHWWRSRKPTPPPAQPQPQPDEAERLLEELLAQSESARGLGNNEQRTENRGQTTDDSEQKPEASGQKSETTEPDSRVSERPPTTG